MTHVIVSITLLFRNMHWWDSFRLNRRLIMERRNIDEYKNYRYMDIEPDAQGAYFA